jgi:hypothetical protein
MARARAWVRGISLGALLITVIMVGNCSATGLSNARGMGTDLIRRDPGSYLITIAILTGPLLILLLLPLVLTFGSVDRRRATALLVIIASAGFAAVLTAYAGFVASYASLCVATSPTPANDAACAGGTGALAGFFGIVILVALPFAVAMRRDAK